MVKMIMMIRITMNEDCDIMLLMNTLVILYTQYLCLCMCGRELGIRMEEWEGGIPMKWPTRIYSEQVLIRNNNAFITYL